MVGVGCSGGDGAGRLGLEGEIAMGVMTEYSLMGWGSCCLVVLGVGGERDGKEGIER